MQEKIEKFSTYQQKIMKEIKRTLESEKLALWSCKADFGTLALKQEKIQKTIESLEETYNISQAEVKEAMHECEFAFEMLNLESLKESLQASTPWKIIQDILAGICRILGFQKGSWGYFLVCFK